jgi:hypothetical protein
MGSDADFTTLLQGRLTSSRDSDQRNHSHDSLSGHHLPVAAGSSELQSEKITDAHSDAKKRSSATLNRLPHGAHAISLRQNLILPTAEDAGMADLVSQVVHFSTVKWGMVCLSMLVWLVWDIQEMLSQDTANAGENESMFKNVFLAFTWISLGISMIMFNKFLFLESGMGFGFAHPILLNWFHMLATAIFTNVVRIVRPDAMPGMSSLTVQAYCYYVAPVACLQMIALAVGNMAYLYIAVSYIQMVKNTTSAFVFIFSAFMGFEVLSGPRAVAVMLVITGMLLTTGGNHNFNLIGFALQMSATISDSLRLCLTKVLMSTKYSVKLDPLSAICVSSISVCVLFTIPMFVVDYPHVSFAQIWNLKLVLLANILLVVRLNITSMRYMKRVGPTTYALTGVLKDIVLVVTLLVIQGAPPLGLYSLGFAVTIGGLLCYNFLPTGASTKS